MPGYFINPTLDQLVLAVRDVSAKLDRLNLQVPGDLNVRLPGLEAPPEETEESLIVGSSTMEYVFADKDGMVYPTELQPLLTPTLNNFYYRQLSRLDNLYQISGSYVATNIQQIPVATLESYNTANGTSFSEETTEKLILPLTNGKSVNVPLMLSAEHEWRNVNNGSVIEWLEPFAASWEANSTDVNFKYQKSQYAIPFGSDMEWDISIQFEGLVHFTNEEVTALAGG